MANFQFQPVNNGNTFTTTPPFYVSNSEGLPAHIIGIMDYPMGDPAQADIFGIATNWFGPFSPRTWYSVDDFSGLEVGYNLATRPSIHGSRIYPFTVVLGNAAPRNKDTRNLEAAPFVTFNLYNGIRVFTTLNENADEIEF